ncbi:glutathione reductase (NADPH) [Lacinutrix venerupis]|uniref:dihydrolipoyl dehydrogenase family protein n=1 Tax=Lacinutrix venerupis TaxID=1486034 RepID=UPI000EAFDF04|nr:NAD(P)/FAD-dependent oxidoreductase [Lacinutrix venerupis]RLJ63393.1 glutathione reductase (NADPH) [Lacinutrix venerupis]
MKTKHYNVFVIGSGIAGQTVAKACVKQKLTVAIADNREFGGTCANRGCDPKKIVIQFSALLEQSQRLEKIGVSKLPKISWKKVQQFKTQFVEDIPVETEESFKKLNIDLYHQSPEFINENEILVEGKTITADYFVIATGRTPRVLPIKGSKHLETSDAILNLKKIPKTASFIGSGYVGMEFATMLAILGCKVTIFEQGDKALSNFDQFLVEKLNKNIKIKYALNGEKMRHKSRKVFNTAGRIPSVKDLKLDNANIKLDETGIVVNDFLQSTTNKKVYACGDVSSLSLPLTPLSGLQGYIVGENIINNNKKEFQFPVVPSTVFTQPNLSSIGLQEDEAKKRYKNILVFKGEATDWFNAKKSNQNTYAYKIIVNKRTQEIVGAHILSERANENINLFSMAISNKMTVSEFKRLIFTYPSYSNDLKAMLADED